MIFFLYLVFTFLLKFYYCPQLTASYMFCTTILCRCCAIRDWLYHLRCCSSHLGHDFHSRGWAVVRASMERSRDVQRRGQARSHRIHGVASVARTSVSADHLILSLAVPCDIALMFCNMSHWLQTEVWCEPWVVVERRRWDAPDTVSLSPGPRTESP